MDKIIFHLGTPKTGTSIIQSHLAQNRPVLRDKGFFYPVTISSDRKLYRTFESHHLLTYSVAGWEPFNRFSPECFMQRAQSAARKYNLHTLLLSAENTYWLPRQIVGKEKPSEEQYWTEKREYMESFRHLFKGRETRMIIYLRRQDRWLESWYNQQIKNGQLLPHNVYEFAEHCEYLLDYRRYLEMLSEVFGRENILVRVYEKEQLPNGLFADFAESTKLGDPEQYPLHQPARYNSQLIPDALEFMQICNELDADPQVKRELRLLIRKVTKQFESQIIFKRQKLLGEEDRARLLEKYAADNEWIAENFLNRKDSPLFMEQAAQQESQEEQNSHLTNEKAMKILMQIVLQSLAEQMMHKNQDKRLSYAAMKTFNQCAVLVPDSLRARLRTLADNRIWNRYLWSYEKF